MKDCVHEFLYMLSQGQKPMYRDLGMDDKLWRRMVRDLQNDGLIEGAELRERGDDVLILNLKNMAITDKGLSFLMPKSDRLEEVKNKILNLMLLKFDDLDMLDRLSIIYNRLSV